RIPAPNTLWDANVPKLYDAYYHQMSCKPDMTVDANNNTDLFFNGPLDVTIPELRYGMTNTWTTGSPSNSAGLPLLGPSANYPRIGDGVTWPWQSIATQTPWTDSGQPPTTNVGSDLIVNDVISFDVQVFAPGTYGFDFINLPPVPPPSGPPPHPAPFVNT